MGETTWQAWAQNRERAADNFRAAARAAEREVASLRDALKHLTRGCTKPPRTCAGELLAESYRRTRVQKAQARKRARHG